MFYVNGLIFLHTRTGKIKLLLVKSLTSRGGTSFIKSLEEIKIKYYTRCFNITDYHGENKFDIKTFKTSPPPALLEIYEKNEHIGIIEQSICTIKECAGTTCHTVTFKRYKGRMKT